MYVLKKGQPEFEVVDGPYAGRKFRHGVTYPEVPEQLATCFEEQTRPDPVPIEEDKSGGEES